MALRVCALQTDFFALLVAGEVELAPLPDGGAEADVVVIEGFVDGGSFFTFAGLDVGLVEHEEEVTVRGKVGGDVEEGRLLDGLNDVVVAVAEEVGEGDEVVDLEAAGALPFGEEEEGALEACDGAIEIEVAGEADAEAIFASPLCVPFMGKECGERGGEFAEVFLLRCVFEMGLQWLLSRKATGEDGDDSD